MKDESANLSQALDNQSKGEKHFLYEFEDGAHYYGPSLTLKMLNELKEKHGELTFNGFRDQLESIQLLRANSHSRGDGFKPGYHPGLGMEIRTNGQYQQVLKERGLIETGDQKRKDAPPPKADIGGTVVAEAKKLGVELSGREIDKITGKIE